MSWPYANTQINLSYTSVTDVGLLSLASISGLQNMTILHLKGLSPGGLGAALLACGGLTKVKLQTSFKSLLPQPLLQHLEARGCVFQWREKPFQVSFSYLFLPTFSLKIYEVLLWLSRYTVV